MNIARKIAVAIATATLSIGLLGISAPAHADSSWWGRTGPSVGSGR